MYRFLRIINPEVIIGGESQAIVKSIKNTSNSSATVADPSAQPWVQRYRPTFTQPESQDEVAKLTMASLDANEVVWLRAIQYLTAAQIGLPNNPIFAARFKAIMVLQAHELYNARKAWQLQYNQVFAPIVVRALMRGLMNIMLDPDHISTMFISLEQYLSHYLIEPLIKILRLKQKLFLPIDSGVSDEVIKIIQAVANAPTESGVNQNALLKAMTRAITAEQLKQSINLQADAFNHHILAKDIQSLRNIDVAALWTEAGITPAEAIPVQLLHESYMTMYDTHQEHCQDSVTHAQRVAPGFTEAMYSECFAKAFDVLRSNPNAYLNNFIVEMLLQQRRLPEIKAELSNLVTDVYLPVANQYFSEQHEQPMTLTAYAQGIAAMGAPLPSLQETVAQAHAILHCDAQVLALPQHADTVAQWTGNANTVGSSSALGIVPAHTGDLMALIESPLFPEGVTVPGAPSHTDTKFLAAELPHAEKYADEFKTFTKEPVYRPEVYDTNGRPEAVQKFTRLLKNANTIEAINALLTVSKPYVNRRRNPIRDKIFGVKNTDTWKTCLKAARLKGLELLKDSNPDVDVLSAQRGTVLFAAHRNESYLKGAWGRTSAQREIDGMIDEVKKINKPK